MGKARILSRVGRGLYTVEPIYDTESRDRLLAGLSAEIAQMGDEIAAVEARIASLDGVISGRLSFVDALLQELRDAVAIELERADKAKQIEAIRIDMASSFDLFSDREAEATGAYQQMISELDGEIADMEGAAGFATALRARIDEVMTGLSPLSRELGLARHDAAMLHIRRANSLQQRDALLAAEPPAVVEAWCADYSTRLPIGAEVATIEVPGEPVEVLIYPQAQGEGMHHPPRDGIVSMRAWQAPEQAYLNAALLPGWQRHMPTYRFGFLFNLRREQNLCDVQLLEHSRSSAQNLPIDPGPPINRQIFYNVPITYMQCHGEAFEEGDDVVLRFLGQDWSRPVVIGFRRFPRRCGWPLGPYLRIDFSARRVFTPGPGGYSMTITASATSRLSAYNYYRFSHYMIDPPFRLYRPGGEFVNPSAAQQKLYPIIENDLAPFVAVSDVGGAAYDFGNPSGLRVDRITGGDVTVSILASDGFGQPAETVMQMTFDPHGLAEIIGLPVLIGDVRQSPFGEGNVIESGAEFVPAAIGYRFPLAGNENYLLLLYEQPGV